MIITTRYPDRPFSPLDFGRPWLTMAKKKRTVTSFAHKSFENSPSVLKFLLKLLFSIIKHHWKNQWPALNSFWIIDVLKVLVRWSEIQCKHIRIYKEWINKFKKTILNLVRFWWNLKWKLTTLLAGCGKNFIMKLRLF